MANHTVNLFFEAKINEYVKFYVTLYYICNLNCQMFMTLILFILYIKGDLKLIKKFRKMFYLLFIIFATLVTPPDIVTQLMLCVSIILIFEILILTVLFQSCFNLEAS